MSLPSGTEKLCAVCHQDCSDKQRTKDAKGRYYCKECYEEAVTRARGVQHAQEQSFGLPLEEMIPPPMVDAGRAGIPTACPSCGRALRADAVLCTTCGFNTQLGYRVETPSPISAAVKKSVPWFFSPLYLFIKPATFFRNFANSPPALTALFAWVFGMAGMIDRIESRMALAQMSGKPVPFTTDWGQYWLLVALGGILAGALYYGIGGWWYRVRIGWSGAKNADRKLVRRVYILASMVYAIPMILCALLNTARYPSPLDAAQGAFTIADLFVMVCLMWSIWNSFVGVRTVFQTKLVPSIIWFLVLPAGLYLTVLVGAAVGAMLLMAAPPSVTNPKVFNAPAVRFTYPSNWQAAASHPGFDAEFSVTVEPLFQDASMQITVYEAVDSLEEELAAFVGGFRMSVTDAREVSTFDSWGKFTGAGQELVVTAEGTIYRTRIFIAKLDERRAILAFEICEQESISIVERGFTLVRSTTTAR